MLAPYNLSVKYQVQLIGDAFKGLVEKLMANKYSIVQCLNNTILYIMTGLITDSYKTHFERLYIRWLWYSLKCIIINKKDNIISPSKQGPKTNGPSN